MRTEILTPKEVAIALRIPIRATYRLIRKQGLRAFRVGRKLRILSVDFDEYLRCQRERGPTP